MVGKLRQIILYTIFWALCFITFSNSGVQYESKTISEFSWIWFIIITMACLPDHKNPYGLLNEWIRIQIDRQTHCTIRTIGTSESTLSHRSAPHSPSVSLPASLLPRAIEQATDWVGQWWEDRISTHTENQGYRRAAWKQQMFAYRAPLSDSMGQSLTHPSQIIPNTLPPLWWPCWGTGEKRRHLNCHGALDFWC